jgi:pimeloyl-ACP methyl ester carboxylesterase
MVGHGELSLAVIGGLKLRRPVLVGWSLGGLVIGGYLRRHKREKIAGLNRRSFPLTRMTNCTTD